MGHLLRSVSVAGALALSAVPASAATTVVWNPTTDTGATTDFDTASQTFAGVNADSISFAGNGYFHNHGSTTGFDIVAIVNGTTQTIFSYSPGGPADFYYLSNLGSINFAGGLVTGIGVSSTSYVGNAFHNFGDETFTLGQSAAVPEPRTWALFLLGFGAIGLALRRRKTASIAVAEAA